MTERSRAGRGRRPGAPDTRAEILGSARSLFAERGFKGTSMRAIASEAGVDPALVHHYFGTKDDLFMAALQLPVDPRELLAPVIAGGKDDAAVGLLRTFLSVWDDPDNQLAVPQPLPQRAGPAGGAAAQPGFRPGGARPGRARARHRPPGGADAGVASQMIGLIMCRYVLRLEPLASMDPETAGGDVRPDDPALPHR